MNIIWSIWYQLLAHKVWLGSPLGPVSYTRWRKSFWASPSFEQILYLLIRVIQVIEFKVHITERGFIPLKIFSLKMFFENNKGWGPIIGIYFILGLTNWIPFTMHTWVNLNGWHFEEWIFLLLSSISKVFTSSFFMHLKSGDRFIKGLILVNNKSFKILHFLLILNWKKTVWDQARSSSLV